MKQFLIFLAATLSLQTAQAWPRWGHHCNGPYYDVRKISSVKSVIGSCELKTPLTFVRIDQYYPRLGNLTVDAWDGAYSKATQYKTLYRVDVYNCWGDYVRTYDNSEVTDSEDVFSVENPNLQENVSDSFVANAPMTNAEAKVALEVAHQKCLKN